MAKDQDSAKAVFKQLIETEVSKVLEEVAEARGDKKRHFKKVMRSLGEPVPAIDPEDYPEIKGLEGPFSMKTTQGRTTLYYDPKAGEYYDRKTDTYFPVDLLEQGAWHAERFHGRQAAAEHSRKLVAQMHEFEDAADKTKDARTKKEWELAKYHVQQAIRVLGDLS